MRKQEQHVDPDFEDILQAIRAKASQLSSEEIEADVRQALVEAKMIPVEELARLEAELDAILVE